MPKKLIKRYLPDVKKIKEHQALKIFGTLIHDPNLWHLTRYSVSTAFSVGLFCGWMPIPFQMVLAGAIAIIVHSNLPISVALVWFTNPVTMPPIFYFAYKVGATILSTPPMHFQFELSVEWLTTRLGNIWQPFLLGCFICGLVSAVGSNVIIRLFWRWHVNRSWKSRRFKRRQKKAA